MINATKAIALFVFMLVCIQVSAQHYLGSEKRKLPTSKKWKNVQANFNYFPAEILQKAEIQLDSNITSASCYKFIPNSDTTKFISFYMITYGSKDHKRIFKKDRGVVEYMMGNSYPLGYYCYIVWGLKYESEWYFKKQSAAAFWDTDDEMAKNHYMAFYLEQNGYIDKEDEFWAKGGLQRLFEKSVNEPHDPQIVNDYNNNLKRKLYEGKTKLLEAIVCPIQNNIWVDLQKADPDRYIRRYTNKYMKGNTCLYVHTMEYNRVLLPLVYYDKYDQCWITYYYIEIGDKESTLYEWKSLPTRKVVQDYDDANQISVDVRAIIGPWAISTSSIVTNNKLWDMCSGNNIQLIKKIPIE